MKFTFFQRGFGRFIKLKRVVHCSDYSRGLFLLSPVSFLAGKRKRYKPKKMFMTGTKRNKDFQPDMFRSCNRLTINENRKIWETIPSNDNTSKNVKKNRLPVLIEYKVTIPHPNTTITAPSIITPRKKFLRLIVPLNALIILLRRYVIIYSFYKYVMKERNKQTILFVYFFLDISHSICNTCKHS